MSNNDTRSTLRKKETAHAGGKPSRIHHILEGVIGTEIPKRQDPQSTLKAFKFIMVPCPRCGVTIAKHGPGILQGMRPRSEVHPAPCGLPCSGFSRTVSRAIWLLMRGAHGSWCDRCGYTAKDPDQLKAEVRARFVAKWAK
jgi:ribosomal protein S27AE